MSGLIGRKIGMTSVYDEKGRNLACTLIQAGPCVVSQIKTVETDGYNAVQIGFEEKKEIRTTKASKGHFAKAGLDKTSQKIVEFDFEEFEGDVTLGKELVVGDLFAEGDFVDVVGTSKGKGFQGVVKRYNFRGVGQATHGQHNRLRAPGSIGAASYPARVFKGMRMAGRMGSDRVTTGNLKVLKVYADKNLILVSGCVAGAKNSYVLIKK